MAARWPHHAWRISRATVRDNRARWSASVQRCALACAAHGRTLAEPCAAEPHATVRDNRARWLASAQRCVLAYSIGYPRMKASGESSTTKHRLLHASGPHPIPPPNDPKTNQYNQDLGLIHSTNGNHLESPNEGSSIDHQVTIHLHAQNITMFPTNETCIISVFITIWDLKGSSQSKIF
ncbi:hypothetical protein F511_17496 [Dorcoceras hygrometricum]|uniref:Uncharacterized protein n=1 Tax=Dorcoceras hygrometricum TaxID=472368 RepID=A0A2Z7AHI6_9LAMI|nr:hypothetical protein F511_17496 [Dorcoceras hygrometricum]